MQTLENLALKKALLSAMNFNKLGNHKVLDLNIENLI